MPIRQFVNTAREGFVRNPDATYEPMSPRYAEELGEGYEMEVTYAGAVIATGENNGYSDSDFYAIVETAPGEFGKVVYGSTRGWTYPNSASVDATYEVQVRAYERYQAIRQQMLDTQAEDEKVTAAVGKDAVITGGRKYKGRSGKIVWIGQSYGEMRMKVQPADGDAFFVPIKQGGFQYPRPESRYSTGGGFSEGWVYGLMTEGLPRSMPVAPAEEVVPV